MSNLMAAFREGRIWRVLVACPGVTFIWLQAVEVFSNNYGAGLAAIFSWDFPTAVEAFGE
jgi:hypothetical protein